MCRARSVTARYNRETLEVHYKGKTIAEVLDMCRSRRPPSSSSPSPRSTGTSRPSSRWASATSVWASRRPRSRVVRRSGQAGGGTPEAVHRAHGLRARRAHDRSALRGHPEAAEGRQRSRRQGQHRDRHRAQPRCDQDVRLGDRHGARGRLRWRHRGGRGNSGRRRGRAGQLHRRFLEEVLSAPPATNGAAPGSPE